MIINLLKLQITKGNIHNKNANLQIALVLKNKIKKWLIQINQKFSLRNYLREQLTISLLDI